MLLSYLEIIASSPVTGRRAVRHSIWLIHNCAAHRVLCGFRSTIKKNNTIFLNEVLQKSPIMTTISTFKMSLFCDFWSKSKVVTNTVLFILAQSFQLVFTFTDEIASIQSLFIKSQYISILFLHKFCCTFNQNEYIFHRFSISYYAQSESSIGFDQKAWKDCVDLYFCLVNSTKV